MVKLPKILLLVLLILLILQAGLILVLKLDFKSPANSSRHQSYLSNKEFYEEAYQQGTDLVKPALSQVYGGIIPHHLLVKDKISAFFMGLEPKQYQTIILIGPDHFNQLRDDYVISAKEWNTPYGILKPDLNLIEKLISNHVSIDENPFNKEHAISGLVSFIKKSQPQAKIVPIIIKKQTSAGEVENLVEIIKNSVNHQTTLVIASVDFSHDYVPDIADIHDQHSNTAISNFDFKEIYNLDVDSPPSIYFVLKYLEAIKARNNSLLFHTNSGRIFNKLEEMSTSHSIFYFTR